MMTRWRLWVVMAAMLCVGNAAAQDWDEEPVDDDGTWDEPVDDGSWDEEPVDDGGSWGTDDSGFGDQPAGEEVDPMEQMLKQAQRDAEESARKAEASLKALLQQARVVQDQATHPGWGDYWKQQSARIDELVPEIERLPAHDFMRIGHIGELEVIVTQWVMYAHLDPNDPSVQQMIGMQTQMQQQDHRTKMRIIDNMGDGNTRTIVTDPSGNVIEEY